MQKLQHLSLSDLPAPLHLNGPNKAGQAEHDGGAKQHTQPKRPAAGHASRRKGKAFLSGNPHPAARFPCIGPQSEIAPRGHPGGKMIRIEGLNIPKGHSVNGTQI